MNIGYVICESPMMSEEDTKIISDKSGHVIAEGTLQDVGVQNRNGRIYEAKDLFPELTCARTKELLESGNMKGENGHPMAKDLARQQTIDPNNVVVKYLKFWTDGDKVKAQFTGCNNRLGDEFNRDLLDGEKPSFSLRALGGLEMRGDKAYVKNVKLITYDRVIYPSHKVAYTDRIVSESGCITTSTGENKLVVDESYSGMLVPITNPDIIAAIQHESATVAGMLKNFEIKNENIQIIPTATGSKVQLIDEAGTVFVVGIERHVHNEIMDYCAHNM